jgi:hypothetical protein
LEKLLNEVKDWDNYKHGLVRHYTTYIAMPLQQSHFLVYLKALKV